MPWLSNKSGINYNHQTFKTIRPDLIKVVEQWAKISARLKPDFEHRVEPYKDGTVSQKRLNLGEPVRLNKLPPVPDRRKNYKDEIIFLNKTLGGIKPYTRGLYETMIAEELISRQNTLTQKKRISLILLDSTIEIGCKEYLRNVIKMPPHEIAKKKRHEIHAEVEKHVLKGDDLWTRFGRYYRFRNTLIHETADMTVSDQTINEFRSDAKTFLNAAFKIQFT